MAPSRPVYARLSLTLALIACLSAAARAADLRIVVGGGGSGGSLTAVDLNAAVALARQKYAGEAKIHILVAGPTYKTGAHKWGFFPPTRPEIVIEALDPKSPPVFDGEFKSATWLVVDAELGQPTRMTIRGMTVQNYWSGLVVKGSQHDAAKWNGGNVIEGMTFTAIGQSRPEQKPAFSVITLQRSRDNVVRNNTFLRVGNSVACGGFHAIYMAHASSGNRIEGNVFQGGCGDVIKLRDASSGNRIIRNRFVDQRDAPVVDSYCDMGRMTECKVQECPSSGNVISDNIFVNSPDKVRAVHRATVPGCPASRS